MISDLSKVLPAFSAIVAFLPIGAALHAQSADELIKNGDGCYAKLQAANALRFYLPAERLDPNNERLLVHISREYRHLASDATKAEEKRKLNGIAVDYAKRAVALGPNDPDAQLAVAISYGKLQPLEGNWDKIEASRIIKDAADKAIKLDPHNDLGWHVLGRWHQGLADVSAAKRALAQVIYGEVADGTNRGGTTFDHQGIGDAGYRERRFRDQAPRTRGAGETSLRRVGTRRAIFLGAALDAAFHSTDVFESANAFVFQD